MEQKVFTCVRSLAAQCFCLEQKETINKLNTEKSKNDDSAGVNIYERDSNDGRMRDGFSHQQQHPARTVKLV